MTNTLTPKFLHIPLSQLPDMDTLLIKRCQTCGFTCLNDVLVCGALELSKNKYLGPVLYRQLADYLHERQLLARLKP